MIIILTSILALICLAIYDRNQVKHSLWRNYPIVGRLRWIAEALRPKIIQYFVESDTDGKPIPRYKRNLVYQRAKGDNETVPFGTELDLYAKGAEWIQHSMYPKNKLTEEEKEDLTTITIGNYNVKNPYKAKVLNISAMSYGALSSTAVESLNRGACEGGFYHNTGEGGISNYHMNNGDLVWQIGTGYFGCRLKNPEYRYNSKGEKVLLQPGDFDINLFRNVVENTPAIKMIEIKLSQGAKPGHGGILPGVKNTVEIAAIRGLKPWTDVISPPSHTAFTNNEELLYFIDKLRSISNKPVGIKMCVGNHQEIKSLFIMMERLNITPDFITIDGAEGGTGSAPMEFTNYVGTPLEDGLEFISNLCIEYGYRNSKTNPRIAIIVSGGVLTGFDIFKYKCLGADVCNAARGFMLSLGCIQALTCNTGNCPTGVATNKIRFSKGIVPEEKYKRVHSFWNGTLEAYLDLCKSTGISTINGFDKKLVIKRK